MILPRYIDFRFVFGVEDWENYIDFDGLPLWPSDLLFANSFNGFTGYPAPITAFPINFSVTGPDGPNYYHAYLSQRTDEGDKQYLKIINPNPNLPGTFRISLTALAVSDLGLASATSAVSEEDLKTLLTDCYLYVKRNPEGSIQVLDMLKETLK